MRKVIVALLITAVMLLVGGLSALAQTQSQSPASDVKPTFITLTPGQYVHGWPAFTVSYPKEWVEQRLIPGENFRVGLPRPSLPPIPLLTISVSPNPLPLENSAKMFITMLGPVGKDFNVLYDRPTQLKDGTPAQEAEFEWVLKADKNEVKRNTFLLATKRDLAWILIILHGDKGKISEDLKNINYSLTFLKGKEEPLKVPPDVQEFLDKYCSDIASGNVERIMANFSDQFLNSGMNKAFFEQWFRNSPASPVKRATTLAEATVTVYEAKGDKAYVDGFLRPKVIDDAKPRLKAPIAMQQIIKEKGEWKWYGIQK
jgi:hypothetical protein